MHIHACVLHTFQGHVCSANSVTGVDEALNILSLALLAAKRRHSYVLVFGDAVPVDAGHDP